MNSVPILALEAFLPYRLSVLSNTLSSAIARTYQNRFGISITEWRVLAVLGRHPGLSANEVAERTAMDKVAVSRAVNALLESGRLLRDTHENDRRRSILELSDAGRAIYEQVAPAALAFERALLDDFSAEERAQLFALLDRVERNRVRAEAVLEPVEALAG
ncbi:MAG TPA: MarR family transcriptional regulator [Xanthomonadaceae bacterium]|nr:MarR family transcriptional regulator [Xanthomonadaceae bacterium]